MSFASEFKAFALKGNVVDLAVGVIIGAVFGKIVNDLVMPVVGRLFGGLDFSNYFLPLKDVPAGTPAHAGRHEEGGRPGARVRQLHHQFASISRSWR